MAKVWFYELASVFHHTRVTCHVSDRWRYSHPWSYSNAFHLRLLHTCSCCSHFIVCTCSLYLFLVNVCFLSWRKCVWSNSVEVFKYAVLSSCLCYPTFMPQKVCKSWTLLSIEDGIYQFSFVSSWQNVAYGRQLPSQNRAAIVRDTRRGRPFGDDVTWELHRSLTIHRRW